MTALPDWRHTRTEPTRFPLYDPILQPPQPSHSSPKHTGWKSWCARCQALKSYVDSLTERQTHWLPWEQTYKSQQGQHTMADRLKYRL